MAASATANATSPRPTGQGFGGDEFSNNLFSDLAPLLTLFGEQVTKQFLSMSMGWTDDVLLAVGPLGIMTVIVSAIRVGGVKVLKAFVGRARESRANAEKEILSSTSADVCELWSGQEIVRELGNPEGMKDLVLLKDPILLDQAHPFRRGRRYDANEASTDSTRVLDINSAVQSRVLYPRQLLPDEKLVEISNGAPNIALNVCNSTASSGELMICAILGTILQLGAVVFPAVTTYYFKWNKGGSPVAAYGYPCFAVGTLAVSIGVLFCGRVIEGSTSEHEFLFQGRKDGVQLLRLQRSCTVSDQHFSSFAIFNSPEDTQIRTSRLNDVSYSSMTAFSTLAAIVGFIAQFVGLRALHWSATIVQLAVMLIMTITRSIVRRGLAEDPMFFKLLDGHELAWLTLYILRTDETGWGDDKDKAPGLMSSAKEESELSRHEEIRLPPAELVDVQSLRSNDTRESQDEIKKPRVIPFWISFTTSFPYMTINNGHTTKPKPLTEDRMLDAIVRWEPVTGYWNVKEVRRALRTNLYRPPQTAIEMLKMEKNRLARAFTPLPTMDAIKRVKNSLVKDEHLSIYRDLQRIMPVSTETTDLANTLALTIERVFTFFTKSSHVLWREGWGVSEDEQFLPFGFNVMRGSFDSGHIPKLERFHLVIEKESSDSGQTIDPDEPKRFTWKTDRDALSSVLSLWLFALEMRRVAATNAVAAVRRAPNVELARAPPFVGRRNDFFRIVSPGPEIHPRDTLTRNERLQRWLDTEVETVPLLGSRYITDSPEDSDNLWVVWGSILSSLFKPKLDRSPLVSDSNDKTLGADRGSNPPMNNDIAVRTRADTTIAARIGKLGGRTRKTEGQEERTMEIELNLAREYQGRWINSVLATIANECVTAGLAHDPAEAYTIIVPIFLSHDLLPEAPHDEIRYSRDNEGKAIAERGGKRYHVPTGKDEPDIATASEEEIEGYMIIPSDDEGH